MAQPATRLDPGPSDLIAGLSSRPLSIPSKYFYDDRGSALFDRICELDVYYPTRTELELLAECARIVAERTEASELLELGSGTARKTGVLIEALMARDERLRYVPLDISEFALQTAQASLEETYAGLEVEGVLCDYTESLEALAPQPDCLAIFLGSTIGNFTHGHGVRLLAELRRRLEGRSWLLVGFDLIKPVTILEAAYNDPEGVTEAFNKNILEVVNREVDGNFDPAHFDHLAFFNGEESQIEMHLVARRPMAVNLKAVGLELEIELGETILTEISRKFTRASAEGLLREAGFEPHAFFVGRNDAFGLGLARIDDQGA
jgi:L-histidine N-alpha-methyltransferase